MVVCPGLTSAAQGVALEVHHLDDRLIIGMGGHKGRMGQRSLMKKVAAHFDFNFPGRRVPRSCRPYAVSFGPAAWRCPR